MVNLRSVSFAAALIVTSAGVAFAQGGGAAAQSGGTSGAVNPATTQGGATTSPGSTSNMTGTSEMKNDAMAKDKMAPCPSGMGRASGSNTNGATSPEMGDCKKL